MNSCLMRPGFHPLSILLMILGFVFFWPIGLAILAYILWGDRMRNTWFEVSPEFRRMARRAGARAYDGGHRFSTGNSAFDDYRAAELKRLEEERAALDKMRDEFDEFLRNLRRAKDQEEFDRFKASRTSSAE